MSPVSLIFRDELRLMRRNRVAIIAILLVVLLSAIAAITSYSHQQNIAEQRHRFQTQADREFENQPNRHPHRVVHFGHFVFRPLGALAAFDPGIDPFTGNTMFLEGHRQNSANFGDVRQSSLLIRFGQLTPAFVLHSLAPLLLIFLGYGAITRERERGTLRQLLVQGVSGPQLFAGKLAALGTIAALAALPALIALLLIALQPGTPAGPVAMIAAGYGIYLLLWAVAVVLVSALVRHGRDALLSLLAAWVVCVILLPRVAPDLAANAQPLPTRIETDIAIQRDLRAMGDSHNPDDPYFNSFKARVLKQYGVTRVEDLPVNYKGLLAVEGEKLTSSLFDRYFAQSFALQKEQSRFMDQFGFLSPAITLRRLSMAAAGVDLEGHRRFLEQAEKYRYDIVQRLNQLQAEAVRYEDDTRKSEDSAAEQRSRVDSKHWHAIPDFQFKPASTEELINASLPSLGVLLGWLLIAGLAAYPAARRLQRGLK